jgi:hypothetical protein
MSTTQTCRYCGESFSKSIKPSVHERGCFGLMEVKLPDGQVAILLEGLTSKGERGFVCQCSANSGDCGEVFTLKIALTRHMKKIKSKWLGKFKVCILFCLVICMN